MRIADAADHLLCIRALSTNSYGSGWTADYFDNVRIGKATRVWI